MTEAQILYRLALWSELALVPVTAVVLVFVTAPYGRHRRPGWGPTVDARWGWRLMEGTAAAVFLGTFAFGSQRLHPVPLFLLAAWTLHYAYRSTLYPELLRLRGRPMPLVVAASGGAFNLVNAWINARWVSHLGSYDAGWSSDPRFGIGLGLMAGGFLVHLHSDLVLADLRRHGERGYRLPQRGLHRWVCSPNYLGEIIEWAGWALATWSLPGLAFALFTAANLVPRAISNLRWYRETFADYPARRRALIPHLL